MQGLSGSGRRHAAVAFGAALLVVATASCSSPSPTREYALPKDLCGTKISSATLEPVLPPGKKISAQPTSAVGVQRCRLQVDGKTVLSVSTEKRAADTSARDVATSAIGVDPNDSSADNGQLIYSKTGAVAKVGCPASASSESSVWATARATHASAASDMRRLVEQYAATVAKTAVCQD
ncbi:hypothetical protein OG223_38120 [Streptomyces sp. NBC_01478]|uniref:hypothetical protein n=1 Tax=Streptomyces sp. NBC_01478 TaxID=2903882 RepID=UPI002E33D2E4|nr:hypothetical protein [Streptomyces sp. NBC_01478]